MRKGGKVGNVWKVGKVWKEKSREKRTYSCKKKTPTRKYTPIGSFTKSLLQMWVALYIKNLFKKDNDSQKITSSMVFA